MTNHVNSENRKKNIRLTRRELDVLKLLVEGKTNNDIADALFVTHHTAKAHVSSIIHKFGVKTRLEAAIIAYKNGYVIPRRGLEQP